MMEKIDARVLIIDDDPDVLTAARIFLRQHVKTVHTEADPGQALSQIQADPYDVIFLDMNFSRDAISGKEGFWWMDQILQHDPAAVIILITAFGDVELAVQAIQEGASNFLLKPWDNSRLLATLTAALRQRKSLVESQQLKSINRTLSSDTEDDSIRLIGEAPSMKKVLATAMKVAPTDANVLILGENGTGKEVIARAIHQASSRSGKGFVGVDLGGRRIIKKKSELFGYRKGAFTDAREDRAGRFEVADGGTIFLDEIGNLSQGLQSKLLTVLQSRRVTRLGTSREIPVDVRLICATNMPLYQMVKAGKFRQDLLYRINTVEINVPPLRERLEDLPLLANYFLELYCTKYKMPGKRIPEQVFRRLEKHHWPGNIRELQHAVERAVIMSESVVLEAADFLGGLPDNPEGISLPEHMNLSEAEKIMIRKVVEKHGGNISRAARELGLTRASLYRRMEKYDI